MNTPPVSYLVAFERIPTSKDELQKLLFPCGEEFVSPFDYSVSTELIIERVFDDISNAEVVTEEKIFEVLDKGYFDGRPDFYADYYQHHKLLKSIDNKYQKKYKIISNDCYLIRDKFTDWQNEYQAAIDIFSTYCSHLTEVAKNNLWQTKKFEMRNKKILLFEFGSEEEEEIEFEEALKYGEIFSALPHIMVIHY